MNHHQTISHLQSLDLDRDARLRAMPQAEEMVLGCVTLCGEITVTYTTQRFGNEATGHMRVVSLIQRLHGGKWAIDSNIVLPMAKPITSRTGSALAGLPGLAAGTPKVQLDLNDPTVVGASALPPAISPEADLQRTAQRTARIDGAHQRMRLAKREAERLQRAAARRSALRRSPGGRYRLRQGKSA